MRTTTLARRYAGALFETARRSDVIDVIDKIESDLGMIGHSLETMPKLVEALNHPLIPRARKKAIASDIFRDKVQPITLRFVQLVIDKRREGILPGIEPEYVRLANEWRGIVSVAVTSAVPLSRDEVTTLRAKLDQLTGKRTDLEMHEDPGLIGGLTVRIGDTVMDGSVRGYLASLREQMRGNG